MVDDCNLTTDEKWNLTNINPNIYQLFNQFNISNFWGKLQGVEVRWSPRMTLCAGLCCYKRCSKYCSIRLSKPLLTLRPYKDLIQTLLHEMIHAYLFITNNNIDHDAHGPQFLKHMLRINKVAGTDITVYHNFHNEVAAQRTHWWRCDGCCKFRKPYYGYVKRAMNRAPSKNDYWWLQHQLFCGGSFHKIKEPPGFGKKKISLSKKIIFRSRKLISGVRTDNGSFHNKYASKTNASNDSAKYIDVSLYLKNNAEKGELANHSNEHSTSSNTPEQINEQNDDISLNNSQPKVISTQTSITSFFNCSRYKNLHGEGKGVIAPIATGSNDLESKLNMKPQKDPFGKRKGKHSSKKKKIIFNSSNMKWISKIDGNRGSIQYAKTLRNNSSATGINKNYNLDHYFNKFKKTS